MGVSPRQAAGSWRAAPYRVARPGLRFVRGRATCPRTRRWAVHARACAPCWACHAPLHSPTAEGACRAGARHARVRRRVEDSCAPRCPRTSVLSRSEPARGPRGLPAAGVARPQSRARMRPREASTRFEHTACGPPSAARPPPAGREGLGQGSPPGQARHGRARHGPARTRARVRPRWV
jgi:hypothetical protein